MSLRDIVEYYLDEDEAEEFALWAFGDGYRNWFGSIRHLRAWNKLHGEEMLLKQDDDPREDIPKMIVLWKKHASDQQESPD